MAAIALVAQMRSSDEAVTSLTNITEATCSNYMRVRANDTFGTFRMAVDHLAATWLRLILAVRSVNSSVYNLLTRCQSSFDSIYMPLVVAKAKNAGGW
jgi:hypothetical protein